MGPKTHYTTAVLGDRTWPCMHVHGAMQGYETHCLTSIYALNPKLIIWEPMHAPPPPQMAASTCYVH